MAESSAPLQPRFRFTTLLAILLLIGVIWLAGVRRVRMPHAGAAEGRRWVGVIQPPLDEDAGILIAT